ncbi:MAG TPA: ribosome small subunit-dependent GTPase A [Lachnospiraceae bacterium]|nr:ribosome small subunit-dependent GTPase A [Lachnospiraceae bacterium]
MRGKIIRGIAGFYYVYVPGTGVVECKAKGAFRNQKIKPLIGDDVLLELTKQKLQQGNIVEIVKRKNQLIRPAAANVDQAVVIFAASYPKPNLNLLDRFWLMMETKGIPTVICFNKTDDKKQSELEMLAGHYKKSGSRVCMTSTVTGDGIETLRSCLAGKTSIFAGPSGVGKSSVMNALFPEAKMETGEISEKIKRGKHTTRHSELFYLGHDTFVMDTPGFTSLVLPDLEKEELREYYPEFHPYDGECRFLGCVHISEPDCRVKRAVEEKEISRKRYENYKQFFEEISSRKKY